MSVLCNQLVGVLHLVYTGNMAVVCGGCWLARLSDSSLIYTNVSVWEATVFNGICAKFVCSIQACKCDTVCVFVIYVYVMCVCMCM